VHTYDETIRLSLPKKTGTFMPGNEEDYRGVSFWSLFSCDVSDLIKRQSRDDGSLGSTQI
jgi:hypothetical protein